MSTLAVGAITDESGGETVTINTYTPTASNMAGRNLLFNADFRINQRVYVSAATLASGDYGHDRFKAGTAGGDYSFTQLNSSTQVTIASGKSLIQVVEDKNVVGGSYVLSWTGTAEGRVGVDSATPAGAFAVSPILITGQTAGTTMSVEFDEGTLGTIQLEEGSAATPFEHRSYGTELALCQRYLPAFNGTGYIGQGFAYSTTQWVCMMPSIVTPRTTPTGLTVSSSAHFNFSNGSLGEVVCSTITLATPQGEASLFIGGTVASGLTAGQSGMLRSLSGGQLLFTGCEL